MKIKTKNIGDVVALVDTLSNHQDIIPIVASIQWLFIKFNVGGVIYEAHHELANEDDMEFFLNNVSKTASSKILWLEGNLI